MQTRMWILGLLVLCTACPRRTEGLADAATVPTTEARPLVVDAGVEALPDAAVAEVAPLGEEACVDRWLEGRGLDRYGHAEGTMYMGGTPLFDEATGKHTDRLTYVYRKQPDARAACVSSRGSSPRR
ncbi:MAG: hypothetical protein L0Y66_07340 [Myxococcaceae bacterium]|nr:hypothetical protein [Myxococcaceae bacterium]MCI0671349.1 hypothetical protein [Myxococcaceae bacterium]